jgi:hypothetical protein
MGHRRAVSILVRHLLEAYSHSCATVFIRITDGMLRFCTLLMRRCGSPTFASIVVRPCFVENGADDSAKLFQPLPI